MDIFVGILLCLAAYLIGSIPFAYILVQRKRNMDIRQFGSGNVGSTNALRAAGASTAAVVFLCDIAKGALPVFIAQVLGGDVLVLFVGLSAFFGHLYPVWLQFHGGKGVAIGLGISIVLLPQLFWIALVVWGLTLLISRYVSVASCLASFSMVVVFIITQQPWLYSLLIGIAVAFIILRHRSNFRNIAKGTEVKIQLKIH